MKQRIYSFWQYLKNTVNQIVRYKNNDDDHFDSPVRYILKKRSLQSECVLTTHTGFHKQQPGSRLLSYY